MKETFYVAHATRNYGKETIYNMRYENLSTAVLDLSNILYRELGDGEGDLKDRVKEIRNDFNKLQKYSYADCEFWIEKVEKKIPETVWVLVALNLDTHGEKTYVFREWEDCVACAGTILSLSGYEALKVDPPEKAPLNMRMGEFVLMFSKGDLV